MTRQEENKLIERTCKHDAYQAAYGWRKHLKNEPIEYGSTLWYLKQKIDGHSKWLEEQPYQYEYSTSTFIKKDKI